MLSKSRLARFGWAVLQKTKGSEARQTKGWAGRAELTRSFLRPSRLGLLSECMTGQPCSSLYFCRCSTKSADRTPARTAKLALTLGYYDFPNRMSLGVSSLQPTR